MIDATLEEDADKFEITADQYPSLRNTKAFLTQVVKPEGSSTAGWAGPYVNGQGTMAGWDTLPRDAYSVLEVHHGIWMGRGEIGNGNVNFAHYVPLTYSFFSNGNPKHIPYEPVEKFTIMGWLKAIFPAGTKITIWWEI